MNYTEVLKQVREFLSNPSKWTQRALARNFLGMAVPPFDSTACSWCLIGAVKKVVNLNCKNNMKNESENLECHYSKLYHRLHVGLDGDISFRNDTQLYEEVMDGLDSAIRYSEKIDRQGKNESIQSGI